MAIGKAVGDIARSTLLPSNANHPRITVIGLQQTRRTIASSEGH